MVWLMSTLVMLGNWRTSALSNCRSASGARKALMKLTGASGTWATGNTTKKLTRMEPQSTLRRLVMRPSLTCPAMSKPSRSPSLSPSSSARPSSTLKASASLSCQRPATTGLCSGKVAELERLNSRSTKCWARSLVKSSGLIVLPLMLTSRPRIMGYQSKRCTPAWRSAC
ncbi:hypothetical protein FQZ97_1019350 [compost metagenome]